MTRMSDRLWLLQFFHLTRIWNSQLTSSTCLLTSPLLIKLLRYFYDYQHKRGYYGVLHTVAVVLFWAVQNIPLTETKASLSPNRISALCKKAPATWRHSRKFACVSRRSYWWQEITSSEGGVAYVGVMFMPICVMFNHVFESSFLEARGRSLCDSNTTTLASIKTWNAVSVYWGTEIGILYVTPGFIYSFRSLSYYRSTAFSRGSSHRVRSSVSSFSFKVIQ